MHKLALNEDEEGIIRQTNRLDLLDGFNRIIGMKDGAILFDLEKSKLKKFHLNKIY